MGFAMSPPMSNDDVLNLMLRRDKTGSYIWGGMYKDRENGDNLLTTTQYALGTEDKQKNIDYIQFYLDKVFEKRKDKEIQFLAEAKSTISGPPSLKSSSVDWNIYVSEFNKVISTLMFGQKENSNLKKLINKLIEPPEEIFGSRTTVHSTGLVKSTGGSFEEFTGDVNSLLFKFTEERTSSKRKRKTSSKARGTLLSEEEIRKLEWSDLKKILDKYFNNAISPENHITEKAMGDIISSLISLSKTSNFTSKGRTKTIIGKSNKNIATQRAKDIIKAIGYGWRDYLKDNNIDILEFGDNIRIAERVQNQTNTYRLEVSNVLKEKDSNNNEKVFTIDEVYEILDVFVRERVLKNDKILGAEWRKQKTIVKEAIGKKDPTSIVAKWGYAQIKGFFGELATAISVAHFGTDVRITGSESTKTGQIHFDVSFQMKQTNKNSSSVYGMQVKNLKEDTTQSLYGHKDDESLKMGGSPDDDKYAAKYLGEEGIRKMRFLFANGKLLQEEGEYKQIKSMMEKALLQYSDSFLRISAEDLSGDLANITSDIFVLRDKYIPSSYLIHRIYSQIKKEKQKKFEVKGEFPSTPIVIKKRRHDGIQIEKNLSAIQKFEIKFNGITIDDRKLFGSI